MQYTTYKNNLQQLAQKIGDVEQEAEEHKYVRLCSLILQFFISLSNLIIQCQGAAALSQAPAKFKIFFTASQRSKA